jgi:hypothetical protein
MGGEKRWEEITMGEARHERTQLSRQAEELSNSGELNNPGGHRRAHGVFSRSLEMAVGLHTLPKLHSIFFRVRAP